MENRCKLYSQCKQRDGEICNRNCWKFIQLDFQYKYSNIPKGYMPPIYLDVEDGSKVDREKYKELNEYLKNIYREIKVNKRGLFIYGKTKGNGKTSWAIKIMQEYFRQLHRTFETFEEPKGLYINIPMLFKMSRDNINEPSTEFKKLEERIMNSDIVIFDDIGTEAPTKWVKENLYIYITQREMEEKASIYTSNHSLAELEDESMLGGRIVDRIYKQVGNNIIHLEGPSRRRVGK